MEFAAEFIGQLGFPIGIALIFVYLYKQSNERFIETAKQYSLDSQATTKALNEVIKLKERDTLQHEQMKNVILRLEQKLSKG